MYKDMYEDVIPLFNIVLVKWFCRFPRNGTPPYMPWDSARTQNISSHLQLRVVAFVASKRCCTFIVKVLNLELGR